MRIHNPILQPCILCLIMFLSLPLLGQVQLGSDILGEHLNDAFGKYLSISSDGKRVASVAPNNDDNGTNAGHVRVHEYQTATSSWVQVGSDIEEMRTTFYTIEDGLYAQRLFDLFGKECVEAELEEFLALDFFPRSGGGIGVTRIIQAMQASGLIDGVEEILS